MTPGKAIVWELWRKNRGYFLGLLAFTGAWAVINLILYSMEMRSTSPFVARAFVDRETTALTIMFISIVSLIIPFSFTENDSRKGFSGPPARLFASPVTTFTLVTCPMVAGVETLLLFYLGWVHLILRPTGIFLPIAWPMIALAAAMTSFQMILWTLNSFPKIRAGILLLWVFALIALIPTLLELTAWHGKNLLICLLAASIPVSYMASLLAVKRERTGEWESMSWPHRAEGFLAKCFPAAATRFSSPRAAQFWIEWRRNGVVSLSILALGMILLGLGFLAIFHLFDGPDVLGILPLLLVEFFILVWSSLFGIVLARDSSSGGLALSQFIATRPVSTGDLAGAKLRLAAVAAGTGALLFLAVIGPWFYFFEAHPVSLQWLNSRTSPGGLSAGIIFFTTLALGWNIAGAIPLWLGGWVKSAAWAGLIYLGGFIALLNVTHYFLEYHGALLLELFPWIVGAAFFLKIGVAGWAFHQAQLRQLLSRRAIVGYAGVWLVLTLLLLGASLRVSALVFAPADAGYLLPPLILLVVPLARIGLAVLALDHDRHR